MNLSNFTIKAAEVIQQSQQLAFNHSNSNIETEHILKALLDQQDSPVEYLLKKNAVNVQELENRVDKQIEKLPKISGGEPAQNISRDVNNVILRAGNVIKQFNDEFITPEHLLLAVIQGNDNTAKLLKDFGVNEKGLTEAIKELRKGSTVTSQTQETQFNALNKYAKNLNEMARQGKLDPVIGRDEEIRRTLHILSRRSKNNPILVGEPGV
ncbi:MAG: Clp protease N-terminal domain-containing protein, partial [Candidatus Dadabacteria bacterium]